MGDVNGHLRARDPYVLVSRLCATVSLELGRTLLFPSGDPLGLCMSGFSLSAGSEP